jgi:hypothetical protein
VQKKITIFVLNLIAKLINNISTLCLLISLIVILSCKEKKDIIYSHKAYFLQHDNNVAKRKYVELFDIFFTSKSDTIIKKYSNYETVSPELTFIKRDKKGILYKNDDKGLYKYFLYFEINKKCLYTFADIPCDYEFSGEIYTRYDSIRLTTKMLRIYDTLVNDNIERRYVFHVYGQENGRYVEINDKFELINQADYYGISWQPLIPIPDSITKWQDTSR